jgi:hypothetical protein
MQQAINPAIARREDSWLVAERQIGAGNCTQAGYGAFVEFRMEQARAQNPWKVAVTSQEDEL